MFEFCYVLYVLVEEGRKEGDMEGGREGMCYLCMFRNQKNHENKLCILQIIESSDINCVRVVRSIRFFFSSSIGMFTQSYRSCYSEISNHE